ncbi:MAG: SDR family oxidoreductase [Candidatus Saccharimonadales bacterium]
MDSSKFVIIGAHGQLGLALQTQYPTARAVDSDALDITSEYAVKAFDWTGVTHILNAAAYTNVDGAETEGRSTAWAVNAAALANLSSVAQANNITLVHISTDYVFDGTTPLHTETEPLSPLSVYGASKAAGDLLVSQTAKHYILRTSWVIGDGKNFVKTMISLAEKNISPTVVHDQVGRLTFTSELVRAIYHLISTNAPYGTYNVSNEGDSASWSDITRVIFTDLGRDDLTVSNTTTEEYFKGKDGIAPRPLQSTLDLSKIQSTGFESIDWREDLKQYVSNELTKNV